jgi:hypothetical protein
MRGMLQFIRAHRIVFVLNYASVVMAWFTWQYHAGTLINHTRVACDFPEYLSKGGE